MYACKYFWILRHTPTSDTLLAVQWESGKREKKGGEGLEVTAKNCGLCCHSHAGHPKIQSTPLDSVMLWQLHINKANAQTPNLPFVVVGVVGVSLILIVAVFVVVAVYPGIVVGSKSTLNLTTFASWTGDAAVVDFQSTCPLNRPPLPRPLLDVNQKCQIIYLKRLGDGDGALKFFGSILQLLLNFVWY